MSLLHLVSNENYSGYSSPKWLRRGEPSRQIKLPTSNVYEPMATWEITATEVPVVVDNTNAPSSLFGTNLCCDESADTCQKLAPSRVRV